ncbi:hypothetical protein Dip510_001162 [Elusimicrobium posterum]|uniref:hypothetical protein n=1 Tax=Elusimicrobium posterum TaxID=3116653 RepID=UPI003C735D32
MKKMNSLLVFALMLCASSALFAQDDKKMGWELDLKKLSLNITSTEVKNAEYYQGFADSRLTADSQTLIQGFLDLRGNYYSTSYLWANTLLSEYGRTKIRPVAGETTKSESVDRIMLTTDYTRRMWDVENFLGGFEAGPFAKLGYETEFTKNDGDRKQVGRGKLGAKVFEGKYIKSLYAAVVGKADWTYSPTSENLAWETGFNVEQPIREGVKAVYSSMYRQYFHRSESRETDVKRELELSARMDVAVYKNLSVAPFINYYLAQADHFDKTGQNMYVGVSFSFAQTFIKADK